MSNKNTTAQAETSTQTISIADLIDQLNSGNLCMHNCHSIPFVDQNSTNSPPMLHNESNNNTLSYDWRTKCLSTDNLSSSGEGSTTKKDATNSATDISEVDKNLQQNTTNESL